MKLSVVLFGTKHSELTFDAEITGITDKPENVRSGFAFVCVEGRHHDGHLSASQALRAGAAAIICERPTGAEKQVTVENSRQAMSQMLGNFYRRDIEKLRLIGITGTNGKTSTAFFIRNILEADGRKTGMIGTLGAEYDGFGFETGMTTPDSELLYSTMARMSVSGCVFCVMEVSSQALDQERCASLNFEEAVFTNLGRDHFDYHGNSENYAAAKAKLFRQSRAAVLNADDPASEYMASNCAGSIRTYSAENKNAYISAKDIVLRSDSAEYILLHDTDEYRVNVPVTGMFTVYNSLAAVLAAYGVGIPIEKSVKYLKNAVCAPGRAERIPADTPFSIYIDYAHTPDALTGILTSLRTLTPGRLITVFGCGGDRDREKRPLMGRAAARLSDIVILTSDNPRSEDPDEIIRNIRAGVSGTLTYSETDRRNAIALALSLARSGDVVLIAGKGHENYQLTGTERKPFSDSRTVQEILNKR